MTDALDREERDAAISRARSIAALERLAAGCRACHLWARATQTVFGDGPTDARLLVVGEQPGNSEDLEGVPFVGSAGRVLDRALVDAGIDRDGVYVTNVVKHFKWRRARTGKKRIHDKPNREEVEACKRLGAVDVLMTHEAPRPFILVDEAAPGARPRRRDAGKPAINDLLATLKPGLHLCGHHHRFLESTREGVTSVCIDRINRSYLLIDSRTLEYEKVDQAA